MVRESDITFPFGKYLKHRFISRLLPFLFFTAIFMVLPVFFPGEFVNVKLPTLDGYLNGMLSTLFGIPVLMTVISLAICIPLIYLFNKFVPQLVGKPKLSGPLFKNFI